MLKTAEQIADAVLEKISSKTPPQFLPESSSKSKAKVAINAKAHTKKQYKKFKNKNPKKPRQDDKVAAILQKWAADKKMIKALNKNESLSLSDRATRELGLKRPAVKFKKTEFRKSDKPAIDGGSQKKSEYKPGKPLSPPDPRKSAPKNPVTPSMNKNIDRFLKEDKNRLPDKPN